MIFFLFVFIRSVGNRWVGFESGLLQDFWGDLGLWDVWEKGKGAFLMSFVERFVHFFVIAWQKILNFFQTDDFFVAFKFKF